MTANVLPAIFTIEIGDAPTMTFEARNFRKAHELCHEQWQSTMSVKEAQRIRIRRSSADAAARPRKPAGANAKALAFFPTDDCVGIVGANPLLVARASKH
jgi:hypothetical protein